MTTNIYVAIFGLKLESRKLSSALKENKRAYSQIHIKIINQGEWTFYVNIFYSDKHSYKTTRCSLKWKKIWFLSQFSTNFHTIYSIHAATTLWHLIKFWDEANGFIGDDILIYFSTCEID